MEEFDQALERACEEAENAIRSYRSMPGAKSPADYMEQRKTNRFVSHAADRVTQRAVPQIRRLTEVLEYAAMNYNAAARPFATDCKD